MIARIWTGMTLPQNFEAYSQFLLQKALPDYRSTPGNSGLQFLRRKESDCARFVLITYWDSIESIKKFAGSDFEKAKYYPEDKNYLLSFPERVEHFEIFAHE